MIEPIYTVFRERKDDETREVVSDAYWWVLSRWRMSHGKPGVALPELWDYDEWIATNGPFDRWLMMTVDMRLLGFEYGLVVCIPPVESVQEVDEYIDGCRRRTDEDIMHTGDALMSHTIGTLYSEGG